MSTRNTKRITSYRQQLDVIGSPSLGEGYDREVEPASERLDARKEDKRMIYEIEISGSNVVKHQVGSTEDLLEFVKGCVGGRVSVCRGNMEIFCGSIDQLIGECETVIDIGEEL